ncbi:MAG: CsgG/HfaB family protein [Phycisphaerales bacterium]
MQQRIGSLSRVFAVACIAMWAASLIGCQAKPELDAPRFTISPYDQSHGELLWAVAPLRNESATTTVDPLAMSDKIVEALEQVHGIRALPMNRTLETMRAIRMPMLRTPADANKLAEALGVDALVVGAITAYDPYDPRLGLALTVVPRTSAMNGLAQVDTGKLDARAVQTSTTEITQQFAVLGEPTSSASLLFDGKNQAVQMDVRTYAEGRAERVSAAGWRRYLRSVDLFAEFAAYRTVDQLVQAETLRLAKLHPKPKQIETAKSEKSTASAAGH